jgi:hypothetical protein
VKVAGLLVVAGWLLLTAAAAMVALPAGLAVAGAGCLWVARTIGSGADG